MSLFLCLLYPLFQFGLAAYSYHEFQTVPSEIPDPPAGLLGKNGINLFQEIEVATLIGAPVIAFLFCLIGMMKCTSVPNRVHTRGLVGGALLLALITLAGFLILHYHRLSPFVDLPQIPRLARDLANRFVIYVAITAAAWFLLFLGQATRPLPTNKVLTDVAYSALLVLLFFVGVHIADEFYPLSHLSPKFDKEDYVQVYTIEKAVGAILAALIILRMISIAGVVRKSIRLWQQDNQATLDAAAQ